MSSPLIVLGLDAADPALLETWIDAGHLPNLEAIINRGAYGRLETFDWYRAELPWTTFLTGAAPEETGYWAPIKYSPLDSKCRHIYAFDYDKFPPFYARSPKNKRMAIFDMPQAPIADIDGVQVLAWGTHSGQTASISKPRELYQELVDKHGPHPLLNDDEASIYRADKMLDLFERMKIGIERRADICIDLLQREKWDFFLTIFGEVHVAGHYFWHLGCDHPLAETMREKVGGRDLLLESFQLVDAAVGRIREAAPDDAVFSTFAAHGMGSNVMDLPSLVFLPELLYRWNFPDRQGIRGNPSETAPVEPMLDPEVMAKDGWAQGLWRTIDEHNSLRNTAKKYLSRHQFRKAERLLPGRKQTALESPFVLAEAGVEEALAPPTWYRKQWKNMKAFALPSFSEGYVRINVKGRDAHGVVEYEDYDKVCKEIEGLLMELKDARTGKPLVSKLIRTRQTLEDETATSPDADIVVVWQEEVPTDVANTGGFGRIGPLPFIRTGSHRAQGYFSAEGPEIQAGTKLAEGHALDLGATYLDLMGGNGAEMNGRNLLDNEGPDVPRVKEVVNG
ncbi:MAG: alkaline phosphatase family protein [Pseudomonadota bacterium]